MKVSLVQFAAGLDVDRNLAAVRRLMEAIHPSPGILEAPPAGEAAMSGAAMSGEARSGEVTAGDADTGLIVLPEAAMHDFGPPGLALGPIAQSLDGPFAGGLGRMAREFDATVVAGMFEPSDDPERPYNTLVVVDPSGSVRARYRKAHLYDSFGYRESDRLAAGDGGAMLVPLGGLTLGLMTCYDLRFPEFARTLVEAGADTLVVPSAWVRGPLKEDHWVTLLRARAIENTVYVLAAGQCGRQYVGASMVVDPMGVVVAAAGPDEGIVSARVERRVVDETRRRNPSLANRRS